MALLMYGVFRGERSARSVNWLAMLLLVVTGVLVVWLPGERLEAFGGSFVVERLRALPQAPGADRLRHGDPAVARLSWSASASSGSNIRS